MLTQTEANSLITMRKTFLHHTTISIPPGTDQTHELIGDDKREQFFLDLWRATIRLSKLRYQTRGRQVIVLVRLDIDSSPHTNPDDTSIGRSHIHLYHEGYEDKWAFPLGPNDFRDSNDLWKLFEDFCVYCNIDLSISFQRTLI